MKTLFLKGMFTIVPFFTAMFVSNSAVINGDGKSDKSIISSTTQDYNITDRSNKLSNQIDGEKVYNSISGNSMGNSGNIVATSQNINEYGVDSLGDLEVLHMAHKSFRSRNFSDAAFYYQEASSRYIDRINSIFGLAVSLQMMGQNSRAIKEYRKILSLNPMHQGAINNLIPLILKEEEGEALKHILFLESKEISDVKLKSKMGSIFYQKGDFEKALYYFKQASKIEPDNPVYAYNVSIIYEEMGSWGNALKSYKSYFDIATLKNYKKIDLDNLKNKIKKLEKLAV